MINWQVLGQLITATIMLSGPAVIVLSYKEKVIFNTIYLILIINKFSKILMITAL
jgi:hypothetical protein